MRVLTRSRGKRGLSCLDGVGGEGRLVCFALILNTEYRKDLKLQLRWYICLSVYVYMSHASSTVKMQLVIPPWELTIRLITTLDSSLISGSLLRPSYRLSSALPTLLSRPDDPNYSLSTGSILFPPRRLCPSFP